MLHYKHFFCMTSHTRLFVMTTHQILSFVHNSLITTSLMEHFSNIFLWNSRMFASWKCCYMHPDVCNRFKYSTTSPTSWVFRSLPMMVVCASWTNGSMDVVKIINPMQVLKTTTWNRQTLPYLYKLILLMPSICIYTWKESVHRTKLVDAFNSFYGSNVICLWLPWKELITLIWTHIHTHTVLFIKMGMMYSHVPTTQTLLCTYFFYNSTGESTVGYCEI